MSDSNLPTLGTPVKNLILPANITGPAVKAINNLVTIDEGGWHLEHVDGDNDGGWTFGGMTSKLFCTYFPNYAGYDAIEKVVNDPKLYLVLIAECQAIYYQEFYVPVSRIMYSTVVFPGHLSCAINVGMSRFAMLYAATKNAPYKDFLSAWKDFYFSLLRDNPVDDIKFIHGWINRVWNHLGEI